MENNLDNYNQTVQKNQQEEEERVKAQQELEKDIAEYENCRGIFKMLSAETRMMMVKTNKAMYEIMLHNNYPYPNTNGISLRTINNPSYQFYLNFKDIYQQRFLEIKNIEDFNILNQKDKNHFRENFPGEYDLLQRNGK
ncbi:hypothetical protein SAMN05421796_11061 [Chryseobacterium piscicola]|nr:hypothetical protein [Chryseobacterium piscicola]SIT04300.1 hypothetical protein SAMN05421796_11061 [Chryseobacterium piscicola]